MSVTANELAVALFGAAAGGYESEIEAHQYAHGDVATATWLLSLSGVNNADNSVFAYQLVSQMVGSTLTHAQKIAAADILVAQMNAGVSRGQVILNAIGYLESEAAAADPVYGAAAMQFQNKVTAADAYEGGSRDVPTLIAYIANVTSDPATIPSNTHTVELTTSATDNIVGTSGTDLILGQVTDSDQPTAANTLHASDVIDGGAGEDTLRVTADGDAASVTGFSMTNVENLEVRSYGEGSGGVTLGLVNVEDLETVISTTSTADITLNTVQNIVDLDLTGNGDDWDSSIDVTVNYTSTASSGTDDTQNIALDNFYGTVDTDGVETVAITTSGDTSEIYLDGNDITDVTVEGDQDLWLDINGSEGAIHSLDASTFTGDLTAYAELDASSDAFANGGSGDDYLDLYSEDSGSVTVDTGEGDNTVYLGIYGDDTTAVVNGGSGEDYISVYEGYYTDGSTITVDAGEGANTVYVGLYSGSGSTDAVVTVTTGAGSDYVNLYTYYDDLADAAGEVSISTGAGNDTIALDYYGLQDDAGDATGYTIAGGDGDDTLVLNDIEDNADADDAFANVTSIETLEISDYASGSLDGVTTGANDAGIVNYVLDYGSDGVLELTNVANDVTVTFDHYGTNDYDFTLSVDESYGTTGTEASINMQLYSGASDSLGGEDTGLIVDNIETLNLDVSATYGVDEDEETENSVYLALYSLSASTLTTLNITGDAYIDSVDNDIDAENLSLIDASALNGSIVLGLGDVSDDGITVLGGMGEDFVSLNEDVSLTFEGGTGNDLAWAYSGGTSADSLDGGDGDDLLWAFGGNDTLIGGAGDDVLFAGAGLDNLSGGADDDYLVFYAGELTAADTISGGDGDDSVYVYDALGTVNDSFFYHWTSTENLILSDSGGNDITFGAIASDAGIQNLYFATGGTDSVTLEEGFASDLTIYLGESASDAVTDNMTAINGGVSDVTVYAFAGDLQDDDVLTATADAGAGTDQIILIADDSTGGSDLSSVTGFDGIVVATSYDNLGYGSGSTDGDDITIWAGDSDLDTTTGVFTVDASALVDTDDVDAGSLYFSGGDESGGTSFDIIGGEGADSIYAGVNDDTVTAGLGDDNVDGDDGDDEIDGGDGDDTLVGGDGTDTLTGGDGDDTLQGDAGADALTGGDGVDTYVYADTTDSTGLTVDTISGFTAGEDNDVIDLVALIADAGLTGGSYLGSVTNSTLANTALVDSTGGLQLIYVSGENTIYGDTNDNGVIDSGDLAIVLTGLTGTLVEANFTLV